MVGREQINVRGLWRSIYLRVTLEALTAHDSARYQGLSLGRENALGLALVGTSVCARLMIDCNCESGPF